MHSNRGGKKIDLEVTRRGNVSVGSEADITVLIELVRFVPKADLGSRT